MATTETDEVHAGVFGMTCKYSCEICREETFTTINKLMQHFEKNHVIYNCDECTQVFRSKDQIGIHFIQCHGSEFGWYCCSECNDTMFESEALLNKHKVKLHGKMIRCKNCCLLFPCESELEKHVNTKHNKPRARPRPKDERYKNHEKTPVVRTYPKEMNMESKIEFQDTICTICEKDYHTVKNLKEHSSQVHGTAKYKCDLCNKGYTKKWKFEDHCRAHSGESPYCCEVCGKRFPSRVYLRVHLTSHRDTRDYICEICSKAFKTSGSLRNHKNVHTQSMAQICPQCGKRFRDQSHLNRHQLLHSGEKPYACPFCDKRCNQKSNLSIHMRVHTKVTPYQCEKCGQSFTYSPDLLRHRRLNQCEKGKNLKSF